MREASREPSSNRIISALSDSGRSKLLPALERVEMRPGHVLSRVGSEIVHVYFLEGGLVSLLKPMRNGEGVEISAVGREGMAPAGVVFELEQAVFESVVVVSGSALRIGLDELKRRLSKEPELSELLRGYAGAALSELAQTVACNILHPVGQRCSRWLLRAQDGAGSDTLPITQELLATLLGVRRASISIAAEALQRAGLVRYSRGKLTVVNRTGLEKAACECYASIRSEFEHLFAWAARGAQNGKGTHVMRRQATR